MSTRHSQLLPIALGAVGLVTGLLAAAVGLSANASGDAARRAAREASEGSRAVETEVAQLRDAVQRLDARPRPSPLVQPWDPAPLEARLARVEEALGRAPAAIAEAVERDDPARELAALQERVLADEATPEETARFWELMRTSDALPRLIDDLKGSVAARPDDAQARFKLADAYVARLYTVPNGPERGAWAGRAEEQWSAILARDDGNWRARYSLARSLSEWPELFGKGPEAVRHLERLRDQQETRAPEPHQDEVYLLLASLYRRQGKPEQALAALEAGARRHPDSEGLRDALGEQR